MKRGKFTFADVERIMKRGSFGRPEPAPARFKPGDQVRARNMIKETRLPSGSIVPTWGVPIKADEIMESRMLSVPAKDQHRDEIIAELKK